MVKCPECGSQRTWKDGKRYAKEGEIQRYLCRSCGYRFSDLKVKVDVVKQRLELSDSMHDFRDFNAVNVGVADIGFQDSAFTGGKDVRSHSFTVVGKTINKFLPYNRERRVCVSKPEAKNLTIAETRQETAQREGTANVKGKIVEFAWWLKKQGYKSAKNRVNMLKRLVDLDINLWDPESVKEILAKQTEWTDGYKMLMTYTYENFLTMEGLTWQRPRYKQEQRLPFIPTEEELNQLIASTGKKLGTFLQGLKDTGADPGELAKLKWIDLNQKAGTVNITPVKGHNPRILKVSTEFIRRVCGLPKKTECIFNYASLKSGYSDARKRLSHKLNNPRLLKITFTTFRHWKGTTEYHKTKDLLHVKKMLGHKRIQSTMVYINLEAAIFTERNDEFHVALAENTEEACKLIKVGFEYVTGDYKDGGKIFRKRK